jgi:uroporphyrinogen decarboxylase
MLQFQNDRIIRALLRKPVDRTPVWIMRQAGRYLPEFRQLRATKPNFMDFCKTPELAYEATLQPLRRFALDAAIIFSDILTIPDAMGMNLQILPAQGPVIHNPIRSMQDVEQLKMLDVNESLNYVFEAIRQVVKALNGRVPLIGFAGSPWTLACYMIEGCSSKTFQTAKTMLYRQPDILTALLERLTMLTIAYLNAQIKAGARVLMLFDTWGGILTTPAYQQFSLKYLSQIAHGVMREIDGEKIPLIFFTKNGGQWLEKIIDSGCDAIGLDWTVDIKHARALAGNRVALQGNLDPAILFADPEVIQNSVADILRNYGEGSGHVFNLGHGIDPATPIENVSAMIEAVHQFGTVGWAKSACPSSLSAAF